MKTKATKLNQKMNFKEVARHCHSFKHSLRLHQSTEAPYHHQIASDTIKQQQQQQQQKGNFHQQQHIFFLVCLAFNLTTVRNVI